MCVFGGEIKCSFKRFLKHNVLTTSLKQKKAKIEVFLLDEKISYSTAILLDSSQRIINNLEISEEYKTKNCSGLRPKLFKRGKHFITREALNSKEISLIFTYIWIRSL